MSEKKNPREEYIESIGASLANCPSLHDLKPGVLKEILNIKPTDIWSLSDLLNKIQALKKKNPEMEEFTLDELQVMIDLANVKQIMEETSPRQFYGATGVTGPMGRQGSSPVIPFSSPGITGPTGATGSQGPNNS